ncbi:MAG: hypothetical protein J6C98_05755 [Oscillospiraceae bacterium]|nr:hypothetical protein [Oscillospiraceae bacterium]
MNMEAIFILTYVGAIVVATSLACLGYWISERMKGGGSWRQVKRWGAAAMNIMLQVALLWFCGMGIAFCLAMLYRIFARPAEVTALAAVAAYIIGMAAAVMMWGAIWRKPRDSENRKENADGKALGKQFGSAGSDGL